MKFNIESTTRKMTAAGHACPKCGCWEIQTRYNRVLDLLQKTCQGCFYEWKQEPLDRHEQKP